MVCNCGDCEFLGDCQFPVVDYFGYEKPKFVGFSNFPHGPVMDNPARHCEHMTAKGKINVYEHSDRPSCCVHFMQKTWIRPATCGECNRHKHFLDNGKFLCSGFPFIQEHCDGDTACANGKKYLPRSNI